MKITAGLAHSLAPLVDLIFPPRCPLCGEGTGNQGGLCIACWSSLVIPSQPACSSCMRPIPQEFVGDGAQCAACIANPPIHSGIYAATIYNNPSRQLVLAYKHGRKIALAKHLAPLMAAQIPQYEGDPALLIPVPLHRLRIWQRGFNQSALLAQELAKLGKGELLVDGLRRKRATPSLGGMTRKTRERTLAGAISAASDKQRRIKGRRVILVDDVLTSGATSTACIKALLQAGAETVSISCFARVMDEALHGDMVV